MARSKGDNSRAQPLAVELLIADHRSVEELFDQFEQETRASARSSRGREGAHRGAR